MIVFLVLTRSGVRVVKRRPAPIPGEWVIELRVTFPPMRSTPVVPVELPPEPDLVTIETSVTTGVGTPELERVEVVNDDDV